MSPDTAIASFTLAKTPLAGAGRHGFVIGLAGWSGSGKTTLAEQLIGVLTARGRDVAALAEVETAVKQQFTDMGMPLIQRPPPAEFLKG